MKRKTTKEILAESLQELAQKKSIEKITVKEIADNCAFSTTTFYRLFHDKYDLIMWDYLRSTNTIMEKIGIDGYPWSQTLYDALRFFWSKRDYIKNLLLNTSGRDAFVRQQTKAHIDLLENYILKSSGKEILDDDTKIFIRMYVFATVQMISEWLTGEIECSTDHLGRLFEDMVPEKLKQYLY